MDASIFIRIPLTILFVLLFLALLAMGIYLVVLLIRALQKYLRSGEVRKQKAQTCQNLGQVLKQYRVERKMTQEFVAEHLSVSRQAVSKWESGASDPSTSNLLALAKLYEVPAEELLAAAQEN